MRRGRGLGVATCVGSRSVEGVGGETDGRGVRAGVGGAAEVARAPTVGTAAEQPETTATMTTIATIRRTPRSIFTSTSASTRARRQDTRRRLASISRRGPESRRAGPRGPALRVLRGRRRLVAALGDLDGALREVRALGVVGELGERRVGEVRAVGLGRRGGLDDAGCERRRRRSAATAPDRACRSRSATARPAG